MTAHDDKFLCGRTFGHVAFMTLTGALGITFIFIVDAANLFWVSQLSDPQLVAAIGYVFAVQFCSVSTGVGMMAATTALVSRSIGQMHRKKLDSKLPSAHPALAAHNGDRHHQ